MEPYPSPKEFWAESERPHEFAVNCTEHAEWRKFRAWVFKKVEEAKNDNLSYDQKIIDMFGEINLYSDYDKKYELDTNYTVFKYSRKDFNDAKWKPKSPQDHLLKPATRLPEEFRIPT